MNLYFQLYCIILHFKDKIADNLIYVDWSSGKAHPKILTVDDYEAMKSSSKLFARKFDMETDSVILKMLAGFDWSKKQTNCVIKFYVIF